MAKTFTFTRAVLVPYTPEQVFAVVDDVPSYHRFLPNCQASGELSRTHEDIGQRVLGFMNIGIFGMGYRLESNNLHTAPSQIDMSLSKGPFKFLRGQWHMTPLGSDGCKVSLDMQWQYDSPMLAMMLGQRFEGIARQLLDAYVAETARRARLS